MKTTIVSIAVPTICACVLLGCGTKQDTGSKTDTDATISAPAAAARSDKATLSGRPCGLLSEKNISALLHQPLQISPSENPLSPTVCEWTTPGQADSPQAMDVLIEVRKQGDPQFAFYNGRLMNPSTIPSNQPPVVIGDLGDRAVLVPDAHASTLFVRRHATIVRIVISDRSMKRPPTTRAQVLAIGKEVVSHL